MIFRTFFCFLRPAFGHCRLGHPQSLEYFSLFLSFFAFDPLRGICFPQYFCKIEDICTKKRTDFLMFFLFAASFWSRPPWPPLVSGVFFPSIQGGPLGYSEATFYAEAMGVSGTYSFFAQYRYFGFN